MRKRIIIITACASVLVGCGASQTHGRTAELEQGAAGAARLTPLRFNQLALRLDLPVFWQDRDGDGEVAPDEVRSLLFYPTAEPLSVDGDFTPAFEAARAAIVQAASEPEPSDPRLRLLRLELESAAPTLVYSDLRGLPADHLAFYDHMVRVAALIDAIYATQTGAARLAGEVPSDEPEAMSLFRRNWGPRCLAPATEREPACSAIPGAPEQPVDVYPALLQEEGFCEALEAREDSETLLSPFTAVREREGSLVAVPYSEAYREPMGAVAAELRAAAEALTDPEEEPMRTYLRAAAQAFTDDDWEPADEAWAAMNARNSRWYLRVGPDEVYWDPCSQKAGFHVTLALINRAALAWQDRLSPLQADMEAALAALTDAYAPREVAFHLPDFIDIVLNAGDDRDAFGATIGQSLPNWGPVADESRGRTVVMSNLFTDSDSVARRREQAETMMSAESMGLFTPEPEIGQLNTILHEASHNLGPAHEYEVDGRPDTEIFGGAMASVLEELKAQTGDLFLLALLRERGVLTERQVHQAYFDAVTWALGHISRGMVTATGQRKPYSQLAAVQIGFLMDRGALRYDAEALAANGRDRGAFTLDLEAFPGAIEELMRLVMDIKARGLAEEANELVDRYVEGDVVPHQMIADRAGRFPRATLVYSVDR